MIDMKLNVIILKGPTGTRFVNSGERYILGPGEKIIGSARVDDSATIEELAAPAKIGAGDLIVAVTTSIGFKAWWDKKHNGDCLPCKKRQATANYLQFKGPEWLTQWVKEYTK